MAMPVVSIAALPRRTRKASAASRPPLGRSGLGLGRLSATALLPKGTKKAKG